MMKFKGLTLFILIILLFTSCRDVFNDYEVHSDENIQSFTLKASLNPSLGSDIKAEIRDGVIFFYLPDGSDRYSLIPSFEVNGKGFQLDGEWVTSGSSSQDYSSPLYYDLVKFDNSKIRYTVIADYNDSSSGQLKTFSFTTGLNPGLTETQDGMIRGDTIEFNFPFETNIQALMPSFTYGGTAVVSYNGITLTDGAAPTITLANGGILTAVFDDGTSEQYTIKVSIRPQEYIYVSTSGLPGASGSQKFPLDTIEEAVALAYSSDLKEIRVADGNYSLATTLTISENITIRGGYGTSDWSVRNYDYPGARNTFLTIAGGTSGILGDHQGTIVFDSSNIGSNMVLEGLNITAMGGAQNFTTAVSITGGASPTIQFCDLVGASVAEGSALFVKDASPSIFSSQIMGEATNYSMGLLVGDFGDPLVISSRISATQFGNPTTGIALQLEGSEPEGRFYNNYIEGEANTQAAAVRLVSSGGSFINNIFNVEVSNPSNICFWEDGSGIKPDLLQNNNFSSANLGVPLYMKDGSVPLEKAKEINVLGYAASSANSDYRFFEYDDYINDCFNQHLPSPVAYKGQVLSSVWPYDIYGNTRSDYGDNDWSRGAYELDYTFLGEKYLSVSDIGTALYDGIWTSLSIREALQLCNTQDESDVILIPPAATITLSEPLYISSSVYIASLDSSLGLNGSDINRHFVIDDGNGSKQSDVFIRGLTFSNGKNTVEGGSIFNLENLFLYDCVFDDNDAPRGGAVYTRDGLLYIANTVFTLNEATEEHGGAVYVLNTVFNGHNLLFALNFTSGPILSVGSCLYAENSDAAVSFSTFYDNEAMNEAAVYGKNSALRVLSSVFDSNTNSVAGPPDETDVYIDGGSLELRGSVVETAAYDNPPEVDLGPTLFADIGNLDGGDGWKTANDGLQAQDNAQPIVDHGFEDTIPVDWADADDDGNTSELFPYDIKKEPRIIGAAPDAGAYETF